MQYNTAATEVEIAALWKASDFILNLNKKWKVKSNNDQSKGHILHTQSVKFIDKHIPQSPELQNLQLTQDFSGTTYPIQIEPFKPIIPYVYSALINLNVQETKNSNN